MYYQWYMGVAGMKRGWSAIFMMMVPPPRKSPRLLGKHVKYPRTSPSPRKWSKKSLKSIPLLNKRKTAAPPGGKSKCNCVNCNKHQLKFHHLCNMELRWPSDMKRIVKNYPDFSLTDCICEPCKKHLIGKWRWVRLKNLPLHVPNVF